MELIIYGDSDTIKKIKKDLKNTDYKIKTMQNPEDFIHEFRVKNALTIRITADVLNVRKGPGTEYPVFCTVRRNERYHITEVVNDRWGKLISGAGYVNMKYVEVVDE